MTDAAVAAPDPSVTPVDPNDVPFATQNEEDAYHASHPLVVHTGKPPATAVAAPTTQWDGKSDPFAALPAASLPPSPSPDGKAAAAPQEWDGKIDPFVKINADEAAKPPPKLATPSSIIGQGGMGLSQAAISTVGVPGDLIQGAANLVSRGINAVSGTNIPMEESPIGSAAIGRAFGAIDPRMNPANAPEPQNEAERIARSAGMGAGLAVMPGGLLGLGEKAGILAAPALQTAQKLAGTPGVGSAIAGAAAGAGGQAATDAAPDAFKPIAGVVGALGAGGVVGGITKAITPSFAGGVTKDDLVQAAQRLTDSGSPMSIPRAAASDAMGVQRAGQVLANVPVAGDPLVQASKKSVSQLGQAADNLASSTGGATPEEAGAAASKGIKNWVGPVSGARVKAAYDAVDPLINPNVTTDLAATRQAAQKIIADRDQGALSTPGNAVSKVTDAIARPGMTYQGIKTLRSSIGEVLNGGILPADTSQSELKRLYGALSTDLESSVNDAGGQPAVSAWQKANNLNSAISDQREQVMKLLGGSAAGRSDEAVFGAIQRAASNGSGGNAKLLAQARKVMNPSDWQDVASGVIGTLGRDAEGNFSPDRFLTGYGKLSEAGKDALFSVPSGPQVRQSLDDIATISSRFKQLKQFSNPSGTGHTIAGFEIAKEAFKEPITTIASLVGGRILASALAKPATASAVAGWAQKYLNFARLPSPATVAQMRGASTRVAATFGAHLGAQIDPEALLRYATGPSPARADDTENQ